MTPTATTAAPKITHANLAEPSRSTGHEPHAGDGREERAEDGALAEGGVHFPT
jgi:hypothetical protein